MDHSHHDHSHHETSWPMAASATLHCLTGCAIGEILGLAIGTALGWSNLHTISLAVALAFLFGYSFTIRPILRANVPLKTAMKVAFAADTLSITVMEIVDNFIMLIFPGAMSAHLIDGVFWLALAIALGIAFLAAWPVNYYLIKRGQGHARVHQYHEH